MALMQAYIDDSASQIGERTLWMAGYLNSAANWSLFSQAWAVELEQAPAIGYLKMSDALYFKGEFMGWTADQRNEKLRGLARVIRHFQPVSFGMSISLAKFEKRVAGVAPYGLNAYYVGANLVLDKVAAYAKLRDLAPPIDFFFDQHEGLDANLSLFLDAMKEYMPRERSGMVGGAYFRDEKAVLPIQAADMLTWYLRRNDEGSDSGFLLVGLPDIVGSEHFETAIPEEVMIAWGQAMSRLPQAAVPHTARQWKKLKLDIRAAKAKGFVPPYGSRWKNRIAKFFGYPRIPG